MPQAVVDAALRQAAWRPLASLVGLCRLPRGCSFLEVTPLPDLRDLELVDELRRDCREGVVGEEREKVTLDRPVQIDERLRRESFRLTSG